ncbi:MAG: 5-formyltetrahydrofolate cyclo-ligase [Bacteroidales bacterium]
MSHIDEEKRALRQHIKMLKSGQSREEKLKRSQKVMAQVEELSAFKNAKTVVLYWALKDEVYTQNFIRKWYEQKLILLPCTVKNEIVLRPYNGDQQMKVNPTFGIEEPITEIFTDYQCIDLVIVPGVAFDRSNNRLGRGRAFYDRFLLRTNAFKLGICFSFQFFDKIPVDENDIKMDAVILDAPLNNLK